MSRRPPRSTLFPYTRSSDLPETWKIVAAHQTVTRLGEGLAAAGALGEAPMMRTLAVLSDYVARRSEEHTSELQSHSDLVCRLLLEKKKKKRTECLQTQTSIL